MSKDKIKHRMLKPGTAAEFGVKEPIEEAGGIDPNLLEKRLEGLRDTQESVQGLSLWCQANKKHSSAIINTWLKILKKSPVEKRLTLFYLANDVVQHAKRKNDPTVVNQWAFAVQKATPQVRTPSSVSTAISRIFKIWEERSVYSKEMIADLMALLNNVPAKERAGEKKTPETYTASAEKVSAFQPPTLISKVKLAYRLKSHLGVTFKAKPMVHMDIENLKSSIKDRSHGMEVIQEIGQLVEQLKASEAKLLTEVEERRKIVETAEIAIVHYENVRGEAKIVNSAYKTFTDRVEATRDKVLDKAKSFEEMEIDSSPVPSPPPEAPSPPPDDDDFGVKSIAPNSNWANHSHSNAASNIRNDIMDAIKSTVANNVTPQSNQTHSFPTTAAPLGQYDPTMLAAMQQFQQSWGNNQQVAAMSAMMQHMLPSGTNNFVNTQQQPPSGAFGGPVQNYTSQPNLPDVSSIPLPPGPIADPPLPPSAPPPENATTPIGHNPFLPSYPYNSNATPTGNSDYTHGAYMNPTMNYGTEYDLYNPAGPSGGPTSNTYHPYHNQQSSETNSSGHQNSQNSIVSPSYSNHSSGVGNDSQSQYYNSANNSMNSTFSSPGHDKAAFNPMEIFSAALGKNKGDQSSPPGSGPTNADSGYQSQGFNEQEYEQRPYGNFGEAQSIGTNGGEDVEPYTPSKPGMGGNFFSPRGNPRALFSNHRPPRGHRGGRGGSGFGGGFRGRGGPPRGPSRGGRGRFQ